jgi:hypothetical protein
MKKIFKYHIAPVQLQKIEMPVGAKILCVHAIGDNAFLWAEVNPEAPLQPRMIEVFATGQEILEQMGSDREYLGTFFTPENLVFHVYERF